MRSIVERWLEVSAHMSRGEKHPTVNLGTPESWPQLAPLLTSRAQTLAKWVNDDMIWTE
jgi:hypothetical protein